MRILLLCLILASPCYADISKHEIAWQTMHLIDVMQTIDIARSDGGFYEKNPMTRKFIGSHPEVDDVIKWGVGTSIAHYFIMGFIDRKFPNSKYIRIADNLYKFNIIASNHSIGLRVRF